MILLGSDCDCSLLKNVLHFNFDFCRIPQLKDLGLLKDILEILKEKIVVSVAVNILFEKLESFLLPGTHHISTLPNTPVAVGEGIILCEERHSLTEKEFEKIKELFSEISMVEVVDARHLGIAGTLSGCGPAFTAMFIEALSDGAVLHGLPRELSYQLASQMVVGTVIRAGVNSLIH